MLQELRDNPRRAANWRWLRAVQIDGGGVRATRAMDGEEGFTWIRRASRMKRRYEKAGNRPDALYRLIQYDRAMFWAYSIWLDDKAPMRWAIEAYILAGESPATIAAQMGTDPEIVEAYEQVFFNVRDRLNDKLYVVNVVMADAVTRGVSERQYDLLWKLFGYNGGPRVLDAVVSRFSPINKPERPEEVGQFFQDFAVNTVKHKAAVATLTVQINTHTQLAIIDSFVQYVQIEKTSENAEKAKSTIVENIGAMLGALPFRIGTKLESAAEKMLPYDDGAAELRNDELMIVAAGGKLIEQKTIQDLRFPGE